jgi:excinuclease ABC subunit A
MRNIQIRNARAHNLKNIDIDIPKGKFIVITGVSGSGKSSLVFDTLYKEGRNLYLGFIGYSQGIDERKTFDSINGLCPIIAVEQKILRFSNPRSTVGTKTSLNALLRSLYAAEGKKRCDMCHTAVRVGSVCPTCANRQDNIHPSKLNANSLAGICHHCMGRGYVYQPSISKLIPNQDVVLKKITGGWFKKWGLCNNIDAFFERYAVTDEFKFSELSDEAKDRFLYGFNISEGREFIGLLKAVENYERFKVQQGTAYEYQLRKMGEMVVCKECLGYRLCKEAFQITVAGLHIGQLSGLTVAELTQLLDNCSKEFEMTREGKNIVQNIQRYAENFTNVGLPYLTTNRPLPTLSGGEAQRLLLVSHLQSKMDSVMYIFDEPTAGLHETEKKRLVDQLYSLKERGNSVIVVEHDKRMIQRAEHIIDIGPLAGEHGGHIEFNGKLEGLQKNAKSITGTYLSNKISVPLKKETDRKRVTDETLRLRITKAWTNNLKGVAVNIPLGMMVGIAGV